MKSLSLLVITLFFLNILNAQNVGIGTSTPTNRLHVTSSAATSNNATILGVNTGSVGTGIFGLSNASGTYGVQGFSTSGVGVYGNSNNYRAIYGSTETGTALYGYSSNGYGLQTVGNVKISGGNTNPATGALLTSIDGTGNAVWKTKNKVAFSVKGVNSNIKNIPNNIATTVHLLTEEFDYGNDYISYAGSTPTFGNSVFIVPVNGLYHFDAALSLSGVSGGVSIKSSWIQITVIRGASGTFGAASGDFSPLVRTGVNDELLTSLISKDIKLVAGDIVFLKVYHLSGATVSLDQGSFGCHLLFED